MKKNGHLPELKGPKIKILCNGCDSYMVRMDQGFRYIYTCPTRGCENFHVIFEVVPSAISGSGYRIVMTGEKLEGD